MKQFKTNKYKKINYSFLLSLIVFLLGIFIFLNISMKASPKLIEIASVKLNNYNNELIMNFITADIISKDKLNDIIELVKNNKDEIVAINYNMDLTYEILKNVSENLEKGLNSNFSKYLDNKASSVENGTILYYPLGIASDNIYLNNLGPKIPVKVSFLTNLITGIKTDVSNYGINNVKMSIYLSVDVTNNIIVPLVSKSISSHYEVLLGSKVIMGNVPTYMGNILENKSPIVTN